MARRLARGAWCESVCVCVFSARMPESVCVCVLSAYASRGGPRVICQPRTYLVSCVIVSCVIVSSLSVYTYLPPVVTICTTFLSYSCLKVTRYICLKVTRLPTSSWTRLGSPTFGPVRVQDLHAWPTRRGTPALPGGGRTTGSLQRLDARHVL